MGLMLYIQPSGMPCMVKYHCKAPDRKGFIISTSIKHLLNSTSLYFACFHFPWLCYLRAHSTVIFVQSNMKMPMPTVYCYIFINVFCNSYLIPPLFLLVFLPLPFNVSGLLESYLCWRNSLIKQMRKDGDTNILFCPVQTTN